MIWKIFQNCNKHLHVWPEIWWIFLFWCQVFTTFTFCTALLLGHLSMFEEWCNSFDPEQHKGEISELLVNVPEIRALYAKLVGIWKLVLLLYKHWCLHWENCPRQTHHIIPMCQTFCSYSTLQQWPWNINKHKLLQSWPKVSSWGTCTRSCTLYPPSSLIIVVKYHVFPATLYKGKNHL